MITELEFKSLADEGYNRIALIAEAFAVPRRQVTLLQGETARHKRLRVDGPQARPDHAWGRRDS